MQGNNKIEIVKVVVMIFTLKEPPETGKDYSFCKWYFEPDD